MLQGTFLLSDAARAAGVETHVIRNWLQRKTVWFDESEMVTAELNGLPHRITFTSVMRIAIMGHLLDLGLPPSRAWPATIAFTDINSSGFAVGDELREPGELYPTGETLLLAYDDPVPAVVIRMDEHTLMRDVFFQPGLSEPRKPSAAIVNISHVVQRVRARLVGKAER